MSIARKPTGWEGVFACLRDGEVRINLFPGIGIAGNAHHDTPAGAVPVHLRLPNTKVWAQFNEALETVEIQGRDE